MVDYYHGTREFGKDLVIGDFDKLGHVTYHGVQVKYGGSTGLSASDDLIRDCRHAFANPFKHPKTGQEHQISTFVGINAGRKLGYTRLRTNAVPSY